MKKNILFKTLIDILFIFQGFGIFSLFIILPFGETKINMVNTNVEKWGIIFWSLLFISVISYILFMVGIWYLRKVGRQLLRNHYFKIETIKSLKKSGKYFLISGLSSLIIIGMSWFINIYYSEINLYSFNLILNIFLITVGLFFIIQSDALYSAKIFKEENDLTI